MKANASGLTQGKYAFRLTVEDASFNWDSDVVTVTVVPDMVNAETEKPYIMREF